MSTDTTDDIETRAGAAPIDEPAAKPVPRELPSWAGRRVGRYLVLETLGSGGMGEVYLAYDPQLDRRVALKLLRRDREGGAEAQDRLLREAQALAKLSHPNVVAVHDVGTLDELAAGMDRTVYVAMEYIEGPTLRAWIGKRGERGWREIVAAYRAAGAGLAAAHAQGIVHRDFKPTNVIVGADGRVRVLDFGLARKLGEPLVQESDIEESLERSSSGGHRGLLRSSLDVQLTQTGLVLGTPAYMAPEQYAGEEVDQRGDQFSFCVALWEALYGQRPFSGDDAARIVRAVRAGRIREPTRTVGEPKRLRAALRRGLAASPGDRYPNMAALLAEIDAASRPVSRSTAAFVGSIVVVGLAVAFVRTGEDAPVDPCASASGRIEGAWDASRRQAVVAAFEKTAAAYAADATTAVLVILDDWAAAWDAARIEACVATRVRGDQSEELMDLRVACLEHRRADLSALVDVLVAADANVVKNAVQGAKGLQSVDACADPQYLRAAIRPPDDPETAKSVAALHDRLATARALVNAGKFGESLALTDEVLAGARPLGYDPLLAEAALAGAVAAERAGNYDDVRALYDEATFAAARCGHAYVEASALAGLVNFLGYRKALTEDAHRYARHAEAVAARIGSPMEFRVAIAVHEASTDVRAGEYARAAERLQKVLAIESDDPRVESHQQAAAQNLGAAYGAQGEYSKALAALQDAAQRLRRELGAHHPSYGIVMMNVGATEWKLGRLDAAIEHLTEAERVLVAGLGPRHADVGRVLHNKGVVLREQGDKTGSLDAYERALAIKRETLGPDDPSVATTANNVGTLLHELGRDEDAIEYLEQSVAIVERKLGRKHPEIGNALSTLGVVYLDRGDTKTAIPLFEEAIAVREGAATGDASNAEARLGLAQALKREGRDLDRARTLAQEALRAFTADPSADPSDRDAAAALLRDLGP